MLGDLLFAYGVPFGLFGLVTLLGAIANRRVGRARVRRWHSVAERLGLREVVSDTPLFGPPRLDARAGNHRVHFERHRIGKDRFFTKVRVEGNTGVTLLREDSISAASRAMEEREIELGDDSFDALVNVHGPPERVRALLDADTRRIVARMLSSSIELPGRPLVVLRGAVTLGNGDLCAMLDEDPTPPTPRELFDAVEALVALAERLQLPAQVAGRLASSIENEPHWRARLYGLDVLSASYPKDAATLAALRHALADEVPEVRLQAALGLGEEGNATLLEIAGSNGGEDATTAHAIDALGDRFPADRCESVLQQALRWRRLQTADSCIQALGRAGGSTVGKLLAKVLARETGPLAVAAARALGRCGAPEAEAALLGALEEDLPDLRIRVIEALGHAGSVRAVPAIREVAEGPGADAEVRRAARQSVAQIQSRLPGASPGQLSIAEGDAGQLSFADEDPRGRVSLPAGS